MVSNPRINPNEAFRPFENTPTREGRRGLKDRRVFGNGQVKDHFVDVNAKEQFPDNAILQGDIRFTHTGDVTLIPNIMPFGEGSDDDPLMEVMIEIHSKTVLDRAVGEQQVYVLIDGVKYTAFVDSETSSHYFVNPGHEIVFGGFRAEGQTSDCKQLTNEQREAYFRKIEANDTGRESTYTDKRILESVANNTLNGAMTSGASLMVPLSKLDSIEVVLPTVDN
jgi:hypothetical protein